MAVYSLALSLLIFSATHGCSAEGGTQNSTTEDQLNCSSILQLPHQEEIADLVQQFNRTVSWSPFRTGIEPLLDNSSVIYQQFQNSSKHRNLPLDLIAHNGFTELVTLLLCKGFYIDKSDNYRGLTMLISASSGGQLGLVKMLLGQGADPEVKSSFGWTALMKAAYSGHLDVVKTLVEAGTDTAVKNFFRDTALDIARDAGKTEVVRYLEQLPH